jgi:hypothetical protein
MHQLGLQSGEALDDIQTPRLNISTLDILQTVDEMVIFHSWFSYVHTTSKDASWCCLSAHFQILMRKDAKSLIISTSECRAAAQRA